jgi:hypothetical protein
MEQLKRWADNVCMLHSLSSACLPFCHSISRRRQAEPKVFIIMCANPSSICYQLSIFVLALLYIKDGVGMWVFINNC